MNKWHKLLLVISTDGTAEPIFMYNDCKSALLFRSSSVTVKLT